MGGHEDRWDRIGRAIAGEKLGDANLDGGSLNYKLMDSGVDAILFPEKSSEFLGFLREMKRVGHMTIEGPKGVACEAGAPGMHWSFNMAPAVGNLLWSLRRGEKPGDPIRSECVDFIANEAGLDRAYRYKKVVCLPCPRLKDEKKQKPVDGYRDQFVTMLLSGIPRKQKNWDHPQALVLRTMRDVLALQPSEEYPDVVPITQDELRQIQTAPIPKLYLPINRRVNPRGGYLAWLSDTPQARKALGRDACNWVVVHPNGAIEFGTDWEPYPEELM